LLNLGINLRKMHPKPPPKNHLHNSWDSMLSASTRPKCYPPKFWNWPNFSPRMTSACSYLQVHDFLIRCSMHISNVVYNQIDWRVWHWIRFRQRLDNYGYVDMPSWLTFIIMTIHMVSCKFPYLHSLSYNIYVVAVLLWIRI
jgi:hypothetical protein